MTKNNGKPRHFDNLKPSEPDQVALAQAIEPRFLELVELYARKWGGRPIPIPKEVQGWMILWRTMLIRHRGGDPRNSPSEWKATKSFAQWTYDEKCELTGQPKEKLSCLE